jgi:hypothetical protein
MLYLEPHISDVASGNVLVCDSCDSMNVQGSNYCRNCGAVTVSAAALAISKPALAMLYPHAPTLPAEVYVNSLPLLGFEKKSEVAFMPIPEQHESLLEKLDKLEHNLEIEQNEIMPENAKNGPDDLDIHEETLKNIAFTLDTLIADLLEAEVREYAFPEFIHPDETGFPMKDASAETKIRVRERKGRSLQEAIVLLALVSAIFLVGMTFGLWGSFFFGF